eukprot:gnl/TRDRNA2_/TRDRNA2_118403_c1_seq1.p1 gnl/TRDRNA2_/TRDRNA2_118403_c1~~gnl/TRDRNA2_/TRDRNA2_118403_c1_seq1.p1  ORF type:complete len:401 (-),score=92.38 gnl/TRDRNA2_/TRDRNA2_118403_c1_seq1:31-1116(-)
MVDVPENVFEIVVDAMQDDLMNQAFRSPPYSQCSMRFQELTSIGSTYPAYQMYEALQSIKREDLANLASKLFEACHVEALVLGNATPEDAQRLTNALCKGLQLEKPLAELPKRGETALPPGKTLWLLDSTDGDDPNHAVFMHLQLPNSLETEAMLKLLDKVLAPKFFDILRTQQQLGYIVQLASSRASGKFSYLVAVIQTEFPPDYVRGRVDAFFQDHFAFIEEKLDDEEFETCRAGLIAELKMKPKNLHEELGHYSNAFNQRTYDFGRRKRTIEFLENVTLASLRTFAKERASVASRLYTQVRKVLDKPDKPLPEGAVVPEDPADLRKWTTHKEAVKTFHESATWEMFNSAADVRAAISV